MKRFLVIVALCCSLLSFSGGQSVERALPVNVKESTRKAAAQLNILSRVQREAALSEIFGLLFMPDGKGAYSSKTSYQKLTVKDRKNGTKRESIPFHHVSPGAQFVGSDGKLYDFYAALPQRGSSSKKKEAWNQAKLHIHHAGRQAVRERYSAELEELEVQRAIHCLRQMSPQLRQSLFAEMLDMLYTEDGKNPYTGETREESISGEKVPYRRVQRSAKFLDAEGNPCGYYSVKDAVRAKDNTWYTWWGGVKLAIHHVGQEKIFAPFMEEIRAMKRHAAACP